MFRRGTDRQWVTGIAVVAGAIAGGTKGLAAQPAGGPVEVVESFHAALASGDSATALGLMLEVAVIFEAGGAEMSRQEYRNHHLAADIEFSMAVDRVVTDQRVDAGDDVAWVLTRSATAGTFRDQSVDAVGVETMILVRTEEGWRISHIHWSSRRTTR